MEKQTIAANTDGEGKNAKHKAQKPPYVPEEDELLTYGKTHPERVALMWQLCCISLCKHLQEGNCKTKNEKPLP